MSVKVDDPLERMAGSRLSFARLACVLLAPAAVSLLLWSCGNSDPEPPEEGGGAPRSMELAKVSLDGGGFDVRAPRELAFKPWIKGQPLTRGTTIRTRGGIIFLTFMGSDQVQVGGGNRISELILEGEVASREGKTYVLGLKKGNVRVLSYADCPTVLKMPHGEVRGHQIYSDVTVELGRDGTYTATVQSLSNTPTEIRNALGKVTLSSWGKVRVDEKEPPKIIQAVKSPRR